MKLGILLACVLAVGSAGYYAKTRAGTKAADAGCACCKLGTATAAAPATQPAASPPATQPG